MSTTDIAVKGTVFISPMLDASDCSSSESVSCIMIDESDEEAEDCKIFEARQGEQYQPLEDVLRELGLE